MESVKNITLFTSVLLVGLSAGLFYAWAVSVIPGTRKVTDDSYLEVMKTINRAILNPAFFLIFLGPATLMMLTTFLQYKVALNLSFWLVLSGTLTYLFGTVGVTIFGNVPMNEALDAIQLADLTPDQLRDTRLAYEGRWNRYHLIRTVFSVLAFGLSLLAIFFSRNQALKDMINQ